MVRIICTSIVCSVIVRKKVRKVESFGFFLFFHLIQAHGFIYLFIYFISWRLITLQYCGGFCHTLKWISHGFTCVPPPDPPSHDNPICKTEKETQKYGTDFWTLWERMRVGCFKRTASKPVYYLGLNRSPAQVGCMRQVLRPGALGRPRGIGWRGRWESFGFYLASAGDSIIVAIVTVFLLYWFLIQLSSF